MSQLGKIILKKIIHYAIIIWSCAFFGGLITGKSAFATPELEEIQDPKIQSVLASKPIRCFAEADLLQFFATNNFEHVSPMLGARGTTIVQMPQYGLVPMPALALVYSNLKTGNWVMLEILTEATASGEPNACILLEGTGLIFDRDTLTDLATPKKLD
jgi:hypothetical protein